MHAQDETDLWAEEARGQRPEGGNSLGPSRERQDLKVRWGALCLEEGGEPSEPRDRGF